MRDPQPENITGEKQHVFEWSVNVGHVLLALAVIVVALQLGRVLTGEESDVASSALAETEEVTGDTRR